MPLRFIFKYLANNEQLVQRIADSYPMRKIARMCISMFYRTQEKLPPGNQLDGKWIKSFFNNFKNELTDGFKDAQRNLRNKEGKR